MDIVVLGLDAWVLYFHILFGFSMESEVVELGVLQKSYHSLYLKKLRPTLY